MKEAKPLNLEDFNGLLGIYLHFGNPSEGLACGYGYDGYGHWEVPLKDKITFKCFLWLPLHRR